jgi:hypothetical protein
MADGLAGRIPGLEKHRSASVPAPSEDRRPEIQRLLREAIAVVADEHPDNALQWLRDERPDVIAYMCKVEDEVDEAAIDQDIERLRKALRSYMEGYRRAFDLYKTRLIQDVQGGLFK